jgi:hypothetical protein
MLIMVRIRILMQVRIRDFSEVGSGINSSESTTLLGLIVRSSQ